MKWKLFGRKVSDMSVLFTSHFVEVKSFYATEFDAIPCISFIGELDVSKAFAFIDERYKHQIVKIYQHNYYDHDEKMMRFNNTIMLLSNQRMIELAHNYCQVLHTPDQFGWANILIGDLAQFREKAEPVKENRVIGFARHLDN